MKAQMKSSEVVPELQTPPKKKRDLNECLERLADLIKANVKDEAYPQVEELINEAKSHIGKSEEQKAGGHGTPAKVDAKGGGKGKGKSKNKGKKEIDELPRFDLSRTWPKALQTTWQAVSKSLEEGEKPRGEICIVKNVQHLKQLQICS